MSEVSNTPSGFVSAKNRYEHTVIEMDAFYGAGEVLRRHETIIVEPPCQKGFGCRALSGPDQESCGFDPKTGYCNGRMP